MSDTQKGIEVGPPLVVQSPVSRPPSDCHGNDHNRDYAGAVGKTDPEEIRLVRKLDIRIMVRPSRPWQL